MHHSCIQTFTQHSLKKTHTLAVCMLSYYAYIQLDHQTSRKTHTHLIRLSLSGARFVACSHWRTPFAKQVGAAAAERGARQVSSISNFKRIFIHQCICRHYAPANIHCTFVHAMYYIHQCLPTNLICCNVCACIHVYVYARAHSHTHKHMHMHTHTYRH